MLSSALLRARSQRCPHVLPTRPEPNPESRPPTLPPAWGPASISTGSASRPALCSQNAEVPGAAARKVCKPYLKFLAQAEVFVLGLMQTSLCPVLPPLIQPAAPAGSSLVAARTRALNFGGAAGTKGGHGVVETPSVVIAEALSVVHNLK